MVSHGIYDFPWWQTATLAPLWFVTSVPRGGTCYFVAQGECKRRRLGAHLSEVPLAVTDAPTLLAPPASPAWAVQAPGYCHYLLTGLLLVKGGSLEGRGAGGGGGLSSPPSQLGALLQGAPWWVGGQTPARATTRVITSSLQGACKADLPPGCPCRPGSLLSPKSQ